jgi:Pvc16 N-terminal domain
MSSYTALAEVGESLAGVLWQEIQLDPVVNALIDTENKISLKSPADLANDLSVRLSIYLYRVVEDPFTKNQFPVMGNGARLRKAPLTLDLFYLITPLVGEPRDQQIVLGKVLQVLYDRAILEGSDLVGSLATANEPLRAIFNPVSLEETARVWQALELSYRLSVCYVVRVAIVDSTREQFLQPVLERSSTYGESGQ